MIEQSLIKKLERFLELVQKSGWAWPLGLSSLVVMTAFYTGLYLWLQHVLPTWVTTHTPLLLLLHPAILMSNVVAHELGHWMMYRRAGLRPSVFFFIIGGLTFVPDEEWDKRQPTMTMGQFLGIFSGGIVGNLLLIALATPWLSHPLWHHYAQAACALNGTIIIANILPFPGSDGARILRRIYGPRGTTPVMNLNQRLWVGGYVAALLIAIKAITMWPIS